MSNYSWKLGQVKFFDGEKGFGFIHCLNDAQDYFVHITKVNEGPLLDGNFVIFGLHPSKKKAGAFDAVNVFLLSKFTYDFIYLRWLYTKFQNDSLRSQLARILPPEYLTEIIAEEVEAINIIHDNNSYALFKKEITNLKGSFNHALVDSEVAKAFKGKIPEIFIVRAWLDSIILEQPEYDNIVTIFQELDETMQIEVLLRLSENDKKRILEFQYSKCNPITLLNLILKYLKRKNNLGLYVDVKKHLTDIDFWANRFDYILISNAIEHYRNNLGQEELFEMFLQGYVHDFPSSYLIENSITIDRSKLEQVIYTNTVSIENRYRILLDFARKSIDINGATISDDIIWSYRTAKAALNIEEFTLFCDDIGILLDDKSQLLLWEKGLMPKINLSYIKNYLLENGNLEHTVSQWISKKIISKEIIASLIQRNIEDYKKIENQKDYYGLLKQVDLLKFIDANAKLPDTVHIKENAWLLKLGYWLKGFRDEFDFEQFKKIVVFLSNSDQLRFLKKVFWLKHTGKFDFTIEDLRQIILIDHNLYALNKEFHTEIPLDISLHIAIETMVAYKKYKTFLLENDLFKIVLSDVTFNPKHRVHIREVFNSCPGRYSSSFDWQRNGEITLLDTGWEISFPYSSKMVSEVKKLPYRTYNEVTRKWLVPLNQEKAINDFANQFRFFIRKPDGNNYSNNPHLAEWKRESVPNGIIFCEGRLSNINDKLFDRPFWWCCNEPCFENFEPDRTDTNFQTEVIDDIDLPLI